MRKYDSYKDSGIDWIGNIPTNWTTSKLKYHTKKIIDGAHFTPTYIEKGYGAIPFLRVTDLHNKEIDTQNIKYIPREEHEELIKRCHPQKGDLLLSKNGTIGLMKIIDWDWEFSIFVSLCLIKFETELINSFFFYFFESNIVDRQLFESSQKTSVTNLHLEKIKELRLTLPPVEEQTQIANYLDQKTTQIDDLISKKEKLIQLLEEERIAIINQAVTKGLNPEAPMKDSGIEWLGEIPEHWEATRLKFLLKEPLKYGANEPATEDNPDNPRYIRITDFGKNGKLRSDTFKSLPMDKAEGYLLKQGDILFARSGATVGKTFLFDNYEGDACFAGYLIKANCNSEILNYRFLYFFTKSSHYESWKESTSQQATIENIGADKYNQLKLAIPPILEQEKIVNHLLEEETSIEKLIEKVSKEIELLKEYKTTLISEVVTGKVDVREEVIN